MVELIVILLFVVTIVTPLLYFAGEKRRNKKVMREIEKAKHQAEELSAAEAEKNEHEAEQHGTRRTVTFVDGKFDFHNLDRDDGEKHDHDPRNMFK